MSLPELQLCTLEVNSQEQECKWGCTLPIWCVRISLGKLGGCYRLLQQRFGHFFQPQVCSPWTNLVDSANPSNVWVDGKNFLLASLFFFFSFGGCGVGCGGYCFLSLILHSVFHYLCHRKIQDSDISKLAMKQSNRRPSSTTYFQTEPKLMTTCNHRLAQHSSRLAQWWREVRLNQIRKPHMKISRRACFKFGRWGRVWSISKSIKHVYDLSCVIQIVLGFTWFLSNRAGKNWCIRGEDPTRYCITNDFKHMLIRSVITYTQHKISLPSPLCHWSEDLFRNHTFTDAL